MSDSGDVLATWLGAMAGRTLSGTTCTMTTRDGPMTSAGTSGRYQIGRMIDSGGQAAVAEVTFPVHLLTERTSSAENKRLIPEVREWREWTTPPASGTSAEERQLVARVEFYPRDARELRRREVLLFLAHLSRTQQDRYPALIRVKESFLVSVAVAQFSGYVADPGTQHLSVWVDVMERCTPLRNQLTRMPNGYDPAEGIRLVSPLLWTIGQLYEDHKLVHRDIDEGNVLISADGTLRLADWGIAHPMSGDHTHTHTVPFGKRVTTPPELREGAWEIGHFTDSWQCGRLVGYVLTGASPFLGDGVDVNSPRLRTLPPEVRGVVEDMCRRDPKNRISTSVAADRLFDYALKATLREREPGEKSKGSNWIKQYRYAAWAGVTALIFVSAWLSMTFGFTFNGVGSTDIQTYLDKVLMLSLMATGILAFFTIAGAPDASIYAVGIVFLGMDRDGPQWVVDTVPGGVPSPDFLTSFIVDLAGFPTWAKILWVLVVVLSWIAVLAASWAVSDATQ